MGIDASTTVGRTAIATSNEERAIVITVAQVDLGHRYTWSLRREVGAFGQRASKKSSHHLEWWIR